MLNQEKCWKAVQSRDATKDGAFFYGVLTTGVYCRPSCSTARQAKRGNMRFYENPQAAEADGLRPCKRCRPLEASASALAPRIEALCRYIETHADETLTLETLSRQAHLSPYHLQRQFKAQAGVTPKQYQEACRMRSLRSDLRDGGAVTQAIYDAGFGSASRVYEKVASHLGMTPKQYRAGGKDVPISYAAAQTPFGCLLLGATDRGLCFVQFGDDEESLLAQLHSEYPNATLTAMQGEMKPVFQDWMQTLVMHLDGRQPSPDLPLDVHGTAFQIKVWRYLQKIPYGELQSYAEVARGIGQPKAVRAVASACASNRVALLIPCHRVIRGDGSLGGYRWGLERKRALIDRERETRAGT